MFKIDCHEVEKGIRRRIVGIAEEVGDANLTRIASDEYYNIGRVAVETVRSPHMDVVLKRFFQGVFRGSDTALNILTFQGDQEELEFMIWSVFQNLIYSSANYEAAFYSTEILKPFRGMGLRVVEGVGLAIEDGSPSNLEKILHNLPQPAVLKVMKHYSSDERAVLAADLVTVAEYTESAEAVQKTAEVLLKCGMGDLALVVSNEIAGGIPERTTSAKVVMAKARYCSDNLEHLEDLHLGTRYSKRLF